MNEMNKEELEKELKKIKEENQILYKILENEFGYDTTHKLIDRSHIEYAILRTNEVLERR